MVTASTKNSPVSILSAIMQTSWMDVAGDVASKVGVRPDYFLPSSAVNGWDVFKKVTYDFSKQFLDASLSDLVVGAGIGAGLSVLGAMSSPLLLGATAVMHVGAVVDGLSFLTQETGDLFHLNASTLSVGVGLLGALAMVGMAVLVGRGTPLEEDRVPTASELFERYQENPRRYGVYVCDEDEGSRLWMRCMLDVLPDTNELAVRPYITQRGNTCFYDTMIMSPEEFLEHQKPRLTNSKQVVSKQSIEAFRKMKTEFPIGSTVIVEYCGKPRELEVRAHIWDFQCPDRPRVRVDLPNSYDVKYQDLFPEELREWKKQYDTADLITDETPRTTPTVLETSTVDLSALREEFSEWRSLIVNDELDGRREVLVARVLSEDEVVLASSEESVTRLITLDPDTPGYLTDDSYVCTPEQLREWNPV